MSTLADRLAEYKCPDYKVLMGLVNATLLNVNLLGAADMCSAGFYASSHLQGKTTPFGTQRVTYLSHRQIYESMGKFITDNIAIMETHAEFWELAQDAVERSFDLRIVLTSLETLMERMTSLVAKLNDDINLLIHGGYRSPVINTNNEWETTLKRLSGSHRSYRCDMRLIVSLFKTHI